MWEKLSEYRKLLFAALIAGATTAQALYSDGVLARDEWWQIGLAVLAALGVWRLPNKPQNPAPPA